MVDRISEVLGLSPQERDKLILARSEDLILIQRKNKEDQ
jgi:hypothetical protein